MNVLVLWLMAWYDDFMAWLTQAGSPIVQFVLDHPFWIGGGLGGLAAIIVGYKLIKSYREGPSMTKEEVEAQIAEIQKNLEEE